MTTNAAAAIFCVALMWFVGVAGGVEMGTLTGLQALLWAALSLAVMLICVHILERNGWK